MDATAIASGILIGLFSGVGTSLLSARVVPHFQHRYWQQQRLFEARSATVKELKRLLAEYQTGYLYKTTERDPGWRPSKEFEIAWAAMEYDVETLFSARSRKAVRAVQALFIAHRHQGDPLDLPTAFRDLFHAGNAAMRALYEEIGLELPAA